MFGCLREAVFRARDSESFPEVLPGSVSIDSMPSELVSFN